MSEPFANMSHLGLLQRTQMGQMNIFSMIKYKNLGGKSGVHAYEIGRDYIVVRFNDGGTYLYNYESAGISAIEQMKQLAEAGKGLATFINVYVKDRYASKLK